MLFLKILSQKQWKIKRITEKNRKNFELVTYERIWNAIINSTNGDGSLGLLFDAYVVYLIMDFCQFYETPFR